ncbi:M14 family zinc carboxypeptidase [Streptomyces sp. NPDC004244]
MYRTVAQIDLLTELLALWFPGLCERFPLPETSVQHRNVYAVRLRAGGDGDRRAVLLVGGTHSRELMNPDALAELTVDLIVSYLNGSDVVYGGRTWKAEEVKVILESLDVWIVPCMNPDGREYVMNVDDMWRKNLRDNPGTACDGVDLNRNADLLWGVTEGQTSCSPCSGVYVGPSAFSEPETRNIKYLLDTYHIHCFADVHSYSELVLHPWGHAPTQTVDPTQQFTGLPSATCMPIGVPDYQEYMTPRDLRRFQTVAQRVVDAITAVRGRVYTPQTGFGLYGTTGTQSDYAYSRHIASPTLHKTYGFTLETGPWVGTPEDSFHPADPTLIKRDAKSGLMALLQQSICGFDVIAAQLLQRQVEVDALSRIRDEELADTEAGREWIALFERVQAPLSPFLLADERLAGQAAAVLEDMGRLAQDEDAVLTDEEVELGLSLVGELGKLTESPDARADLTAAGTELDRLRGLTSAEVVRRLRRRSPER